MNKIKRYLKRISATSLMVFLFCAQPINSVLGSQTAINSDKIYGEFTYSRDEENSDVLVQAKLSMSAGGLVEQLKDGKFVISMENNNSQILGKGCSAKWSNNVKSYYHECEISCSFPASSIGRYAEYNVVWQNGNIKESIFNGSVSDFKVGSVKRVAIDLDGVSQKREALKFTVENSSKAPIYVSGVAICDDATSRLSILMPEINLPMKLGAGETFSFTLKLNGMVDDLGAKESLCVKVVYGDDVNSVLDEYKISLFKSDLVGINGSSYIIRTFNKLFLLVPVAVFTWKFWPSRGVEPAPKNNPKKPPPGDGPPKPPFDGGGPQPPSLPHNSPSPSPHPLDEPDSSDNDEAATEEVQKLREKQVAAQKEAEEATLRAAEEERRLKEKQAESAKPQDPKVSDKRSHMQAARKIFTATKLEEKKEAERKLKQSEKDAGAIREGTGTSDGKLARRGGHIGALGAAAANVHGMAVTATRMKLNPGATRVEAVRYAANAVAALFNTAIETLGIQDGLHATGMVDAYQRTNTAAQQALLVAEETVQREVEGDMVAQAALEDIRREFEKLKAIMEADATTKDTMTALEAAREIVIGVATRLEADVTVELPEVVIDEGGGVGNGTTATQPQPATMAAAAAATLCIDDIDRNIDGMM